jgi:hypothetical protein
MFVSIKVMTLGYSLVTGGLPCDKKRHSEKSSCHRSILSADTGNNIDANLQ